SASGSSTPGKGPSWATLTPCTWCSQRGAEGRPSTCCKAPRLDCTASPASPLRKPRLKRSNGGAEMPGPCRVVIAACTCGAAGQSGKIQLSFMATGMGWGVAEHRILDAFIPRTRSMVIRTVLRQIRAQGFDQQPLVIRSLGAEGHGFAAGGVDERQFFGMQRLAAKAAQGCRQLRGGTLGQLQTSTVQRVADQRMADMRQVHADLMGAPGLQLALQQAV